MEVEKEAFGALIEYYKVLPSDTKKIEIINQVQELISCYSKICTKFGIMTNMSLNKEMLNLNNPDLSEDDFLNALYAYLNALQDITAQFINKVSNVIKDDKI